MLISTAKLMEICSHNVIRLLTPNKNRLSETKNTEVIILQSKHLGDWVIEKYVNSGTTRVTQLTLGRESNPWRSEHRPDAVITKLQGDSW